MIRLTSIYNSGYPAVEGTLPYGYYSSYLTVSPFGTGIGTYAANGDLEIYDYDFAAVRLESGLGGNTWALSSTPAGGLGFNLLGSGAQEVTVNRRLDGAGRSTVVVDGSTKATNFIVASSREFKTELSPLEGEEVLAQLAEVPISEWQFKEGDGGVRHFGPMAEDFFAAFGLGADGQYISVIDASGVALAAIQGLNEVVERQKSENVELRRRLQALEVRVRSLAPE